MTAPKLRPEEISELKLMLADGVPRKEIAEAFGVGQGAVTYHAIRAGYAARGESAIPNTIDDAEAVDAVAYRPPAWTADALCAQTDPELFFPEKGASSRDAKATCDRCTVSAECLDTALANGERFGVWGGLSERQRRKIAAALDNTTEETA